MWMLSRNAPSVRTNDLVTLPGRLDRIMGEMLATAPFVTDVAALNANWSPAVDVFEGKDTIRIVAELPGVRSTDVKIALENHTLTLRGEKRQESQELNEKAHRYERTFGSFERSFSLPTSVDADKITAVHSEGVLTVTLPKVERARPREIPVTTQ